MRKVVSIGLAESWNSFNNLWNKTFYFLIFNCSEIIGLKNDIDY